MCVPFPAERRDPARRGRLARRGRERCGRRGAPFDFGADDRRHLGAEELYRAHEAPVRHRADAELKQKALVAEDLVLKEDLLDYVLRAADEVRSPERRRSIEVLPCVVIAAQRSRPILSIIVANGAKASSAACRDVSAMKPWSMPSAGGS